MTEDDLLDGLDRYVPRLVAQRFGADCCIPATRVLVKVLEHFGITAEPIAVTCEVMNKTFRDALEQDAIPQKPEEYREWSDKTGAVCIKLGATGTGNTWNEAGHLVALVPKYH